MVNKAVLKLGIAISLILLYSISLATSKQHSGEGLSETTSTCLDCHEDMSGTLTDSPHELTSVGSGAVIAVQCVSCHDGAAEHIDDPSPENISNPAKQHSAATQGICSECHVPHIQMGIAGFDPHLNQDISCTDCHSIHRGFEGQLLDEETGFCSNCHVAVINQFRNRSNHPLTDQAITCLSCHNIAGNNDVNFGHGRDANCYQCHPEHSGPYRYEHEAVSSFSTDGGGCVSCHRPHGSVNDRLLNQPGDGLCRQCHGVPPMHAIKHGGIGTQFGCVECHSQIHGSYDNSVFLDPQMGVLIGDQPGSCYCHDVNEY